MLTLRQQKKTICRWSFFLYNLGGILFGNKDNEYVFDVTLRDDEMYDHYINKIDSTTEEECYYERKVTLVLENDKLVVSDF